MGFIEGDTRSLGNGSCGDTMVLIYRTRLYIPFRYKVFI